MSRWDIRANPQPYARMAGAIYLGVIVFGGFSEGVVMDRLVTADPAATAHNIAASMDLWRWSVAGNVIVPVIAVAQMWMEYLLLRPAGRNLALLFVLLNAVSLAVECVSKVFLLLVAPLIEGSGRYGSFSPAQLYDLAALALKAHDIAFHITLLLFGFTCLVCGALIFRSTYLPRLIGVLVQLAGACYVVASFAQMFLPALAHAITPAILLPCLIGEASLCLWYLIKGVDVTKWNARMAEVQRA